MKTATKPHPKMLELFKEDLLPVGLLEVVWPDAQQPFVPRHAQSIIDAWSWELLGEIIVCGPFKSGKFHICDGQHRVFAVSKLFGPKESVPCRVYSALDKAHAAWLFNQINLRRRRPKLLDIFKTSVTSGAEPEATIARVVKLQGLSIGPGNLMGVSALTFVHKLGGEKLLAQTLISIRETWGRDIVKSADATIIRIFASFLHAYKDATLPRLHATVAKQYTIGRFLGTIRSISDMERISSTVAGVNMLVRIYNTGLRLGKLKGR